MLMPSIFDDEMDFLDDWMDSFNEKKLRKELFGNKNPLYGKKEMNLMKTDVRENKDGYEIDVDLPGFSKDDIKVSLNNGYLVVAAAKEKQSEAKDENNKYIRKERLSGGCQRSYYLGDAYSTQDLKAKYESGVLRLYLPKKQAADIEENKYIAIEG